jgi:hypothetical protein
VQYVYEFVDRVHSGRFIGFTDFIRCEPSRQRSTVPIQSGEPLCPLISGIHHEMDESASFFLDRLPREIETGERTPSPVVRELKLAPQGTKCHTVSSYTI